MPQEKLTIVPVTLHTEDRNTPAINPAALSPNAACTIQTDTMEISFFNGIDERIIQTVLRELKHL